MGRPRHARAWPLLAALVALLPGCSRAESPPDYGRTPVLFVHGHGLFPSDWDKMIAALVARGYPREYLHAVGIVPSRMANVKAATTVIGPAAEALLARAAAAARHAGYQGEIAHKLDIVSHSMGAVSSRWYAVKLRPERVRTWIALAGANHGTNALCKHTDDGAKDLCPAYAEDPRRNPVQVGLNGTPSAPIDETPYGLGSDRRGVERIGPDDTRSIAYFNIWIDPDQWIKPERSAVLDGAGGVDIAIAAGIPIKETSPGNYQFRAWVNHESLLRHQDAIRLVETLLAARDPRRR